MGLGALLLLLLYILCTTQPSFQNSCASGPTYIAGVVEYSPAHGVTMANKDDHFRNNVAAYARITQRAAQFGVDILVFPECGLVTLQLPRNPDGTPAIAVEVPSPEEKNIPCEDTGCNFSQELKDLSCAARDNKMYVVVNLPEREPCVSYRVQCAGCPGFDPCASFKIDNTEHSRPCPKSGAYFYNTNVAFDRTGMVVARYRKWNLFGEIGFQVTPKVEYSTFNTDFGVRFGMFTCFDILFEEPSVKLVEQLGVTDIVFPTAWFSQMPFLTAVQTQAAWAYSMDVNLLGAGYNYPAIGSAGSGIYAGRRGIAVGTMPTNKTSTLLVATLIKKAGNVFDCSAKLLPEGFITDLSSEMFPSNVVSSGEKVVSQLKSSCLHSVDSEIRRPSTKNKWTERDKKVEDEFSTSEERSETDTRPFEEDNTGEEIVVTVEIQEVSHDGEGLNSEDNFKEEDSLQVSNTEDAGTTTPTNECSDPCFVCSKAGGEANVPNSESEFNIPSEGDVSAYEELSEEKSTNPELETFQEGSNRDIDLQGEVQQESPCWEENTNDFESKQETVSVEEHASDVEGTTDLPYTSDDTSETTKNCQCCDTCKSYSRTGNEGDTKPLQCEDIPETQLVGDHMTPEELPPEDHKICQEKETFDQLPIQENPCEMVHKPETIITDDNDLTEETAPETSFEETPSQEVEDAPNKSCLCNTEQPLESEDGQDIPLTEDIPIEEAPCLENCFGRKKKGEVLEIMVRKLPMCQSYGKEEKSEIKDECKAKYSPLSEDEKENHEPENTPEMNEHICDEAEDASLPENEQESQEPENTSEMNEHTSDELENPTESDNSLSKCNKPAIFGGAEGAVCQRAQPDTDVSDCPHSTTKHDDDEEQPEEEEEEEDSCESNVENESLEESEGDINDFSIGETLDENEFTCDDKESTGETNEISDVTAERLVKECECEKESQLTVDNTEVHCDSKVPKEKDPDQCNEIDPNAIKSTDPCEQGKTDVELNSESEYEDENEIYFKTDNLNDYVTFLLTSNKLLENSSVTLCHSKFCCHFSVVLYDSIGNFKCSVPPCSTLNQDFQDGGCNPNDADLQSLKETKGNDTELQTDFCETSDQETTDDITTDAPNSEPQVCTCCNGEENIPSMEGEAGELIECPQESDSLDGETNGSLEEDSEDFTDSFKPRYYYRLAAFNGVRSFDNVAYGGLQVCAIIACSDKTPASCGRHIYDSDVDINTTIFRNVRISGNFTGNNALHLPNTLSTNFMPIPPGSFGFKKEDTSEGSVRITMESCVEDLRFLTFGIYTRNFEMDDNSVEEDPCEP